MRSEMRQNQKFVRFVKECYFNKLLFPTPKRLFRRTFIPPIPVIALASNLAKAAGLLARSCMSLRNCGNSTRRASARLGRRAGQAPDGTGPPGGVAASARAVAVNVASRGGIDPDGLAEAAVRRPNTLSRLRRPTGSRRRCAAARRQESKRSGLMIAARLNLGVDAALICTARRAAQLTGCRVR